MKLHKDEVQIEACDAAPIIKGKPLDFVKWYKVDPDKITICRYDQSFQKEVTEEFDIYGVKLSGVPAGYFLRERPVEENSADVKLNVHIANVDEAIEKAVRLVIILKEAGTLVDELASELEKLEIDILR